jgi:hypothetical protein
MTNKIIRKHLFLNKKTVAHLSSVQMCDIKGGCTTVTIEYTSCEELGCPTGLFPDPHKDSFNTCFTDET